MQSRVQKRQTVVALLYKSTPFDKIKYNKKEIKSAQTAVILIKKIQCTERISSL